MLHTLALYSVIIMVFLPDYIQAQGPEIRNDSYGISQVKDSDSLQVSKNAGTTKKNSFSSDPVKSSTYKSEQLFQRIFGVKNLKALEKDLNEYGNSHLPPFMRRIFLEIVEKSFIYPIVFLIITLILVLLFNIISVIIILRYTNHQKNRRERYINIYRTRYEEILSGYLFHDIDWNTASILIKKKNKLLNRSVLISVLSNFQENLRGDFDNQIQEIFINLGLQTNAIKLIKSPFYYKKVSGIRQLTLLHPKGAYHFIKPYLNHSNDMVRAEAQASYIVLHPEDPFCFLKALTRSFNQWTQLTVFNLYRSYQLKVPSFVQYLNSENINVRNFSLVMITYFQQVENSPVILKMLESPQETTRFHCIRAINDLLLYEGRELIKCRYPFETRKNQIEIIKALRNIGNQDDFDFLENIFLTGFVTARTEACRSLYFISAEGHQRLIRMNQDADLKLEQYLAHITDSRN